MTNFFLFKRDISFCLFHLQGEFSCEATRQQRYRLDLINLLQWLISLSEFYKYINIAPISSIWSVLTSITVFDRPNVFLENLASFLFHNL